MNYHFSDLVDINMVESLLMAFCKLNGMSASLIDADGIPLIRACWQPVCLNFHRKHPELEKKCRQSDAYIQQHVITDSYFIYKCENGILEAVTPIIIGGKHLASLYKGQFFLESVDLGFFKEQALKYGFNENAYIEGIKQIPIYSKEQMGLIMSFFAQLAKLLTQLGASRMAELESLNIIKEKQQFFPPLDINPEEKSPLLDKDTASREAVEKELDILYKVQNISILIEDIINGNDVDDEHTKRIFRTIGLGQNANNTICMIICDKFNYLEHEFYEKGIYRLKGEIINKLLEIPKVFVWNSREGIGLLYQTENENDEINKTIVTQIKNKLLQRQEYLPVNIGISDPQAGTRGFKKAYKQAVNAAIAARIKTDGPIKIFQHREAGIYNLLPNIYSNQSSEDFINENIGKIIEYDRKKKGSLLDTLEEIVSNASVADISKKMFLHPKSVIFRRKRIEKLLNINLNDFETRLALAMAIKLYKLKKENCDGWSL